MVFKISTFLCLSTLLLSTACFNSGCSPVSTGLEETPASFDAIGQQMVLDLFDCKTPHFDDIKWVRETLRSAAKEADATIVTDAFHAFSPHGISGVVVIAESHLAIHTWPEYRYAAIDIFTCGTKIDFAGIQKKLLTVFQAQKYNVRQFSRPYRLEKDLSIR